MSEHEAKVFKQDELSLGQAAKGAIQPTAEQSEQLSEVENRILNGEFHVSVDSSVVTACIDGRLGAEPPRAASAGGTISLMVADYLTKRRQGTTEELMQRTVDYLAEKSLPLGDHTDDHASGDKTGCGANDNLEKIFNIIATKGQQIRALATDLGFGDFVNDDEVCDFIEQSAGASIENSGFFSKPTEVIDVLQNAEGAVIDTLTGGHNEAMIVLNKRPKTTLDHNLMAEEFGEAVEAFNVDVWAFEASARAIADNPEYQAEVTANITALIYYNFATALALCGPEMPVVTLE